MKKNSLKTVQKLPSNFCTTFAQNEVKNDKNKGCAKVSARVVQELVQEFKKRSNP